MKDHFKKILIAFVTVSFASVLGAADALQRFELLL